MLVGPVVIHDEMEGEFRWSFAVDLLEESDKFLVPMAWHAVADHLAIEHAQRCKQRGSAIALVIVRHGPTATLLQRETGLSAVEGLDLTFLVDAQDQGLVRRIQIEPDNVGELRQEVLVAAELESLDQVWLEIVLFPNPVNGHGAQPLGLGHTPRAPMGCVDRFRMESRLDHSLYFLFGNGWYSSWTRSIFFQSSTPQRQKAFPPKLNSGTGNPHAAGYFVTEISVGRHLDDTGSLHETHGKTFPLSPPLDGQLFLGRQNNTFGYVHRQ